MHGGIPKLRCLSLLEYLSGVHMGIPKLERLTLEDVLSPSSIAHLKTVRPDMRYCFRSGRCRPNPRTKDISVPPRHITKSYIPDFNMISQHYSYKDTTCHTSDIQVSKYNTLAEGTCLSTDYNKMP